MKSFVSCLLAVLFLLVAFAPVQAQYRGGRGAVTGRSAFVGGGYYRSAPFVGGYSYGGAVYVMPAPFYYAPPAIVVAPAPLVVAPAPLVVAPPPYTAPYTAPYAVAPQPLVTEYYSAPGYAAPFVGGYGTYSGFRGVRDYSRGHRSTTPRPAPRPAAVRGR